MIIAFASGKGGTGKTTVSAALALSAYGSVRLLDCDVEEPNGHFFIQPDIFETVAVTSPVPVVDASLCTGCGECGRVCQFSAIVALGTKPMVFPELCHSCGGCLRICPTGAISESPREIGTIQIGARGDVEFVSGTMLVGHAMAPPIIRAVKKHIRETGLTLIDCPPGTACPFVTAVKGCDVLLLVTEPTPFGLHDLTLAVDTARAMGIPFGVVVNRISEPQNRITEYCEREHIPVLLQIPEDRAIAEAYSRGETMLSVRPELRAQLAEIPLQLKELFL